MRLHLFISFHLSSFERDIIFKESLFHCTYWNKSWSRFHWMVFWKNTEMCPETSRQLRWSYNLINQGWRHWRGWGALEGTWKKVLEAFVDHQQSKEHRVAITYEFVVPQCDDVLEMTVNDLNNKRLAERKYLIKVMECIRFLTRQGLGFRVNDGNDNLTQLFKLLNKNDPALLTRLHKETHSWAWPA